MSELLKTLKKGGDVAWEAYVVELEPWVKFMGQTYGFTDDECKQAADQVAVDLLVSLQVDAKYQTVGVHDASGLWGRVENLANDIYTGICIAQFDDKRTEFYDESQSEQPRNIGSFDGVVAGVKSMGDATLSLYSIARAVDLHVQGLSFDQIGVALDISGEEALSCLNDIVDHANEMHLMNPL